MSFVNAIIVIELTKKNEKESYSEMYKQYFSGKNKKRACIIGNRNTKHTDAVIYVNLDYLNKLAAATYEEGKDQKQKVEFLKNISVVEELRQYNKMPIDWAVNFCHQLKMSRERDYFLDKFKNLIN